MRKPTNKKKYPTRETLPETEHNRFNPEYKITVNGSFSSK